MLVIRMKRVGRSGHAQFRVVVQDSRQSPKSGKFIALLGSYDPHAKTTQLDIAKAQHFIKNGAQPSDRVATLLKKEGVKLPEWVNVDNKKSGTLRNPDKLRKNRPTEAEEPKVSEGTAEPNNEATQDSEQQADTPTEAPEVADQKPEIEPKEESAEADKTEPKTEDPDIQTEAEEKSDSEPEPEVTP